jgi:hypothetical protein
MTNPPDQNALNSRNSTASVATRSETDAYLASIRKHRTSVGTGRLIFALDATASRRPTWEMACQLQAQMFEEVKTIGGLSVQLVYYRGLDGCRASKWISRPDHLSGLMEKIDCRMGHTQIGKILTHTQRETKLLKVSALTFVGDAMEENSDALAREAGELGRLGVPALHVPGGPRSRCRAGLPWDRSADAWRLLPLRSRRTTPNWPSFCGAVAVYAAGGMTALAARRDAGAVKLLSQMK